MTMKIKQNGKIAKCLIVMLLAGILGGMAVLGAGCGSRESANGSLSDTSSETTAAASAKSTKSAKSDSSDVESLLEITDPKEKAAVEAAKKKVQQLKDEPRIIATSPATAAICDKLDLDLVGVCKTTTSTIPERYADLTTVGTAMSPDMEIVIFPETGLDLKPLLFTE